MHRLSMRSPAGAQPVICPHNLIVAAQALATD